MRKGESKYPMTLICVKCGKHYNIKKHRISELCFKCAATVSEEFFERKGEHYQKWVTGMMRWLAGELEHLERGKHVD